MFWLLRLHQKKESALCGGKTGLGLQEKLLFQEEKAVSELVGIKWYIYIFKILF